jgi:hypothetical protein
VLGDRTGELLEFGIVFDEVLHVPCARCEWQQR